MTNNNYLLKYTMTYGLYLGLAFSVVVFVFHLIGRIHIPGDGVGVINTMILTFSMIYFGKRYRDSLPEPVFLYRQALGFTVLLSIFSAFIYAVFLYGYYAIIEPQGINYYLDQVQLVYSQQKGLSEEQVNTLIALYKNAFTPGLMAFVIFIMQSFMGVLMGLLVAVFIKTPLHFDKDNY